MRAHTVSNMVIEKHTHILLLKPICTPKATLSPSSPNPFSSGPSRPRLCSYSLGPLLLLLLLAARSCVCCSLHRPVHREELQCWLLWSRPADILNLLHHVSALKRANVMLLPADVHVSGRTGYLFQWQDWLLQIIRWVAAVHRHRCHLVECL